MIHHLLFLLFFLGGSGDELVIMIAGRWNVSFQQINPLGTPDDQRKIRSTETRRRRPPSLGRFPTPKPH